MSPRGVAIEGLRERLFAAAERVLARDGAAALTSRAVTEEAECAKGVLHTHFAGLDEFVAELVLYRFRTAAALSENLLQSGYRFGGREPRRRGGDGTVPGSGAGGAGGDQAAGGPAGP